MRTTALLLLVLICASPASAGEPDLEALSARLAKLEKELERQQREVAALRSALEKARAIAPARPASPPPPVAEAFSEARVRWLLASGELAKALAGAQARLRQKPGVTSRALLAEVLIARGDYAAAYAELKEGLRLAPNHAGATCLLAEVLLAQEDLERACSVLDRLIEANPKSARAYALRGRARLRGKPEPGLTRAIEDLSQALALDPSAGSVYFHRGVAFYETHRFEDAVKDLDKALELGGRGFEKLDARYVLGFAHYYLDQFTSAIADWEEFLAKAPAAHKGRKWIQKFLAKAKSQVKGEDR